MLTKEQKTVLSVITGIVCAVISVCVYGFTVGGDYLSFSYISYCLLTAFIITSLSFLFIFGKKTPKELIWKEIYTGLVLTLAALQLLMYQPLNLLTAEDKGTEYEVDIIYTLPRSYSVYFIDRDGTKRETHTRIISSYDNELWPQTGGKMIVKETLGGFDCKHFEIVKVTYEPEMFY